jgi:hypothetical protein
MPEGAIYVGRTTAGRSLDYGNRYAVGETVRHVNDTMVLVRDRAHAVQLYREWFRWQQEHGYPHDLKPLRGRDLCCWCPLDQPCHADVLLELANARQDQRGRGG